MSRYTCALAIWIDPLTLDFPETRGPGVRITHVVTPERYDLLPHVKVLVIGYTTRFIHVHTMFTIPICQYAFAFA